MASAIEERNLRANVQKHDVPGCKVDDLCALVEHLVMHADIAGGLKNVHDEALLTMMWHTFGRAIDTCFARKQQLTAAASGELFLNIARIKTSVVQGVSIYNSPERWQQCMLHAFGMLFVCYDQPSEYLFPLVPRFADPDLPGGRTYSQEEAVIYWESLEEANDEAAKPSLKKERKRPSVASYISEVIRDTVNKMSPAAAQAATPNMTSHSLRRGAAAYANACPKLAVQWISTRGAWLLESLTKAFAYIGTTTREDQSVGRVLAGYKVPDLPVSTPTIGDLQHRLSESEFGQVVTLRGELYQHVLGSPDVRYNVAIEVVDATFAALLMHLKTVLDAAHSTSADPTVQLTCYEYHLHRSIASTNALLGCRISITTCCEWGEHLTAHWRATNHAQVSNTVSGGDTLLASTMENILKQLVEINERLARLEETKPSTTDLIADANAGATSPAAPAPPPAPATASTLAGCTLNWYIHQIWESVKGKKEQNKQADAKAAVNIMLVLYQTPCTTLKPPHRSNGDAYQTWKHDLWELALLLDRTANDRFSSFDGKKPTTKASSLLKRWRALRASHPEAYKALGAQYLALKASGSISDEYTPATHQ